MPRDLPIGNGNLLAMFDSRYVLRDLYFPRVGSENHIGGHACRLGLWVDGQFAWLDDDGWERSLRYAPETLVTDVQLRHEGLGLQLQARDAVDFDRNVLLREFTIVNLRTETRQVRLFAHLDLHIGEFAIGDTAYYDPDTSGICHYKGHRWFLLSGTTEARVGPDQWACGDTELEAAEGTWRDAEDGELGGHPIAKGSVDSTSAFWVTTAGGSAATVRLWLAAGRSYQEVAELHRFVLGRGVDTLLARTGSYWRLWANKEDRDFGDLPQSVVECYQRSLLLTRTQIDNGGAIIAANDTDIVRFGQDHYSYLWPRDGAFVAAALIDAGYSELTARFFDLCAEILKPEGYFLHKYNPDGSTASSWHAWFNPVTGEKELPIQEDETALVIWALWRHFDRFRQIERIKPFYRPLICRAADFLVAYRDPETLLPLPSYDLWEERRGLHTFTVAAVVAGLQAATNFAAAFGDDEARRRYSLAAAEIRGAIDRHLWIEEQQRYARSAQRVGAGYELDPTIDAANFALFRFGVLPTDHPRMTATMSAIRDRLWCRTEVGGVARYEGDRYQSRSEDPVAVPGNPWIICTLWIADWLIASAATASQMAPAVDLLEWVAARALPSGVLAEQVHPYTGEPLSVSPLTWSHATVVSTVMAYLRKREALARQADPAFRTDRFCIGDVCFLPG